MLTLIQNLSFKIDLTNDLIPPNDSLNHYARLPVNGDNCILNGLEILPYVLNTVINMRNETLLTLDSNFTTNLWSFLSTELSGTDEFQLNFVTDNLMYLRDNINNKP
jgi:hypothetical protein